MIKYYTALGLWKASSRQELEAFINYIRLLNFPIIQEHACVASILDHTLQWWSAIPSWIKEDYIKERFIKEDYVKIWADGADVVKIIEEFNNLGL